MRFPALPGVVLMAVAMTAQADRLGVKGGGAVEGEILGLQGGTVRFQSQAGGGMAVIPYPVDRIERVEFDFSKEEQAVLERGGAEARALLEKAWEVRRPFLKYAGSDAGEVGLRLARLLLGDATVEPARRALKMCEEVRDGDWDAGRKGEAARMRLSALAAAGDVEQAMKEAEQLADAGGAEDEALARTRVRARLVKGEVAWKKVQQMEEEWPKWQLMPELREERRRWVNEALDAYLFVVVRHVELDDLCAEGLWNAAQIYQKTGHGKEARTCAEEILHEYPVADYVARAKSFLAENPAREKP